MEYNAEEHSLKCPKCQHGMQEVTHEGIVIDRCTHCHGLWFDAGELGAILEHGSSAPGGEAVTHWLREMFPPESASE